MKGLALRATRYWRLSRRASRPGNLTILTYHAVVERPLPFDDWCFIDASTFRRQLVALRDRFQVLPLSQALNALEAGELSSPTAALTFDDGYYNNLAVAYPILAEFSLPATIFLTTQYLDSQETLWFCRLNHLLTNTGCRILERRGSRYRLSTGAQKAAAAHSLKQKLKRLTPSELHSELDRLEADLGLRGSDPGPKPDIAYRMLTSEAIRKLNDSGLIEFGSHTRTHPILSRLSARQLDHEVVGSVEDVAAVTGRRCRLFAYPNGTPADYDSRVLATLRRARVRWALTAIEGVNCRTTPPLELRRISVGTPTDVGRLGRNRFPWLG